jgi:hypothetical protein
MLLGIESLIDSSGALLMKGIGSVRSCRRKWVVGFSGLHERHWTGYGFQWSAAVEESLLFAYNQRLSSLR